MPKPYRGLHEIPSLVTAYLYLVDADRFVNVAVKERLLGVAALLVAETVVIVLPDASNRRACGDVAAFAYQVTFTAD